MVHYSSQDIVPFNLKSIKLVTVHDLFGLDKRFNPKSALRYALGKTMKKFAQFENVIAISNKVKKELVDFGFKGEITVIHNAVAPVFHKLKIDRFKIREELNLPTDKKLVLSVSSMEARKNLGAVKDTMDLLGDEYALVRVGGEIDSCTSFSGVDDFTLNKIYNACDVLLNPTLDEGFGAPVAEAMSTGLPVVASDIEILREIAGSSAVLVEPQPLKLTYAVKDAINNSEEYGKKGIERASRFSLEKFNENLSKLYSGISGIDTKLK